MAATMRSGSSHATLVDAIRDDCGQTGTHIGCEHGVCGSCTVIIGEDAVRSCLMFAVQAQGGTSAPSRARGGDDLLRCSVPSSRIMVCNAASARPAFMLAVNALEQRPDIGDEDLLISSPPTSAAAPATRTSSRRCGRPGTKCGGPGQLDCERASKVAKEAIPRYVEPSLGLAVRSQSRGVQWENTESVNPCLGSRTRGSSGAKAAM